MSSSKKKIFTRDAERIAFNEQHRKTIQFNMGKYHTAVANGKLRYANLDAARTKASEIKRHTLANLPEYLEQFEQNFTNNGGTVLWAKTADDAIAYISEILQTNHVRSIVKSKSMTTEEIELNHELEKIGIESVETDLGEYIVQLAGEKPYHIVTPAMHKSKQDVADLFHEKFNFPLTSTAEEMTNLARQKLREKYLAAGAGITGANFIIADKGGICVTENEGNAIMSTAFPKIHIAIAGIEKIIPSFKDLALFWPHLAQHGTGQAISSYNTMFTGPRKSSEPHGPELMYVILLDNGRTNLYAQDKLNVALSCIRCGACLNACPIYKNVGGYTYNTTYQGPIGSVISPHLGSFEDNVHLSTACSLCANCTEVCPVKIPLHELIHENRVRAVSANYFPLTEQVGMKAFAFAASKSWRMDAVGGTIKNILLSLVGKGLWGNKRSFPKFAKQSFRKQYKQRNKKH